MLLPLEPLIEVALDPLIDVPLEPIIGALGTTCALLGTVLLVALSDGWCHLTASAVGLLQAGARGGRIYSWL